MGEFATGTFFGTLAISAGAAVVLVVLTWLIARAVGRYNVIDVAWGWGSS